MSDAFEQAVEAIIAGDAGALARLISEHPELVRERSAREHRSTLLHYVSANGVEDVRQKTPANIVEIAKILLDAGADVNAESEAYGGHSTALNLTATSVHPETAGVQITLMQFLLDRGAEIRDGDVNACLRNGRKQAAEFLADHGATLDIEGAAGTGRLELVKQFFESSSPEQRKNGFGWASEYGHTEIVRHFLDRGMPVETRLIHYNNTALHWAAYGGHREIVELLLARGAPVDVIDEIHKGTPGDWAEYAGHPQIAALLMRN